MVADRLLSLLRCRPKAAGELRLNLDEAESGKRTDQIAADKAGFGNEKHLPPGENGCSKRIAGTQGAG